MRPMLFAAALLTVTLPATVFAQTEKDDDFLPNTYTLSVRSVDNLAGAGGGGVLGRRSNGSLLGIDSVPNWSSYFYDPGFDSNDFTQFTWPYTMIGGSPFANEDNDGGRTTTIGAPIVPVNIDLRNFDGSPRFFVFPDGRQGPRMFLDATRYVQP